MLIPTKYENLNKNLLVLGSEIILRLKKKPLNIEDLYQTLKKEINISLDQFYNCLTFLWLADILILENSRLYLKKKK
jgi:hypothetical protein